MGKKNETDLSYFKMEDDKIMKRNNTLTISDDYMKSFDLRSFLLGHVLDRNFESEENGINVTINNDNDLLKAVVKYLKAKHYIGVGVGGVYIRDRIMSSNDSTEYVLLYKRYHEPENQMWSILGGSSKIHEKIEDTLKAKISRITKISRDSIFVKDIIKANNHEENDFHFLSPAFYVDITNPNNYLHWGEWNDKSGKKKKVIIIKDKHDFSNLGVSTYDCPLLAWVPVDMIDGQMTDSDGDQIFTFTTLQAIECHRHIRNATRKIVNATERIKSYKDWRIKEV